MAAGRAARVKVAQNAALILAELRRRGQSAMTAHGNPRPHSYAIAADRDPARNVSEPAQRRGTAERFLLTYFLTDALSRG